MMSEVGISSRQRRMLKADAIATLFRASDGKRSPKKRLLLLLLNGSRLSRVRQAGMLHSCSSSGAIRESFISCWDLGGGVRLFAHIEWKSD
ncbi:hypothetical protein ILYODFUR_022443 [Ilyodon furcidens]|uniref:Uncharacterized protein n=1 Tax=Ilyodon furcidens TaxID=33524 RepID=A0ABV0TBP1_9TELE